jgi:hypothetical protein
VAREKQSDQDLFWGLIDELMGDDERVEVGTIMGGRCARVAGEFLALVDFKGSGLVVKLPRERVEDLIAVGIGQPFAPAGRVFAEWVSVPRRDRRRWRALLEEGVAFVAPGGGTAE